MSLFTDDFFNNIKTTKSNKTSKKKKDDEDESYTSFTESFFDNSYDEYYKSAGKSQYPSYDNTVYSDEFINEYNSFIDRMNKGAKERYDERVAKTESATLYYAGNKDNIVRERSKNLIYNWNLDDSGGVYNDYGAVPVQDKNGYLKKTDKDGNVYWVDIKKDLLYDDNYKLINDDRLKSKEFMNGLKYEYDKNNKLNSDRLSIADKLGLSKIDASRYMSIVNNELYDTKNVNKNIKDDDKPFKIPQPNLNEPFKPNIQSPVNTIDYNKLSADVYENSFKKLNKAIEEGKLTTANNAIEVINEKYFGHKISDGYIDMLGGNK